MTSAAEPAMGTAGAKSESRPRDVTDLRAAYRAADKFAREVSEFRDAVATPANNELRYAGHHLLRALNDDGVAADPEHLRRAISHCHRAQYEAAEAGIVSALEMIKQFKEDYKYTPLKGIIPDYSKILRLVRTSQELLPEERDSEASDGSGELPDPAKYMTAFRDLREKYHVLEDHREEVKKQIRIERIKIQRFVIGTLATIAVGVVGVIVWLLRICLEN